MTGKPRGLALVLALALTSCGPVLTSERSDAEAAKDVLVERAATAPIRLRFVAGSELPVAADAAHLRSLAARGDIRSSDRVSVAIGGDPMLGAARFAAIEAALADYGIYARQASPAGVPANHAIIDIRRYLVTTPPCPNWSGNPVLDLSNVHASNFGCATAVNLGRLVANPADLVEGRTVGPADALPAVAAVQRYQTDRVVLPTSAGTTNAVTTAPTTPALGPTAPPTGQP